MEFDFSKMTDCDEPFYGVVPSKVAYPIGCVCLGLDRKRRTHKPARLDRSSARLASLIFQTSQADIFARFKNELARANLRAAHEPVELQESTQGVESTSGPSCNKSILKQREIRVESLLFLL
jgi:hypothetical protein